MTGTETKSQKALDRLADALVDDILCASDEELLAEFKEDGGDVERHATEVLALLERSLLAINKEKLRAAQQALKQSRNVEVISPTTIDIEEARAKLRHILMQPEAMSKLTLAARKESELSDADVLGLLQDFQDLGVNLEDETGDK